MATPFPLKHVLLETASSKAGRFDRSLLNGLRRRCQRKQHGRSWFADTLVASELRAFTRNSALVRPIPGGRSRTL
eukprot:3117951-Pleurochrysis_carterae.AAC.2